METRRSLREMVAVVQSVTPKQKKDIADDMDITPQHLSLLFKREEAGEDISKFKKQFAFRYREELKEGRIIEFGNYKEFQREVIERLIRQEANLIVFKEEIGHLMMQVKVLQGLKMADMEAQVDNLTIRVTKVTERLRAEYKPLL